MKILVKYDELNKLNDCFNFIKKFVCGGFNFDGNINNYIKRAFIEENGYLFDLLGENRNSVINNDGKIKNSQIVRFVWDYNIYSGTTHISLDKFIDELTKSFKFNIINYNNEVFRLNPVATIQNYIELRYANPKNILADRIYLPYIKLKSSIDGDIVVEDINNNKFRFKIEHTSLEEIIEIQGVFNKQENDECFCSGHAALFPSLLRNVAYKLSTDYAFETFYATYINHPQIKSIYKI